MTKGYSLVPIRQKDMEQIRRWRNAQIDFLRQKKKIGKEEQKRYWQKVIEPSLKKKRPSLILFSFLYDDRLIGYGGLTYIDWDHKRAEVSFLLDPVRAKELDINNRDTLQFLSLLQDIAFRELKLHRIYSEIFAFRANHIALFERFGFVLEGRLKEHNLIRGEYVDSLIHGLINEKDISG